MYCSKYASKNMSDILTRLYGFSKQCLFSGLGPPLRPTFLGWRLPAAPFPGDWGKWGGPRTWGFYIDGRLPKSSGTFSGKGTKNGICSK